MRINEKPEKPSDEEEGDTQNDFQVAIKKLNFCEQQREATGGQEDDSKGVCNLSFLPFSCTLVSPVLVTHLAGLVFSSMTSLQKEEFFELVATAQARRLDDQRAHIKQLSFVKKPEPVPVPKEDLYNMILTTQAQGRLEDQRSRAPGPMDDEDFFSLLLRVQGGRMDEQRTELPCMLQT
uniref:G protein signaling modulator 3 n=1 Tax=Anabas testudineus TaxID=64144 RepID=A0A3Q1HJ11_ANATE